MKISKNPLDELFSKFLESQKESTKDWLSSIPKHKDFGSMKEPFGDISNTSFDEMLKGLNGNLPQNISSNTLDSLKGFLDGYGDMSSVERTDMLMQYILQLLTTNDQRAWDKSVLQEQRSYDNPMNQLARLLGAGISRDAAIQLLNGSGSGSGGSAALIGSGSGVSVPSVSAPSGTTEIARNQMAFGAAAAIANALVNLCSQGMQMAQAYETYQFQKNQSYLSTQQVEDYNAVNSINQQLQILSDNGLLGEKKVEDFRSANDLTNYLKSISADNPDVDKLVRSDAFKRATGTIFGRDYLNQIMSARRGSQDAGKLADLAITQQELNNNLLSLNQESLSAEISKMRSETILIDSEVQKTMQDIAESRAKIQYINKQGKLVDVQTEQAQLNYEYTSAGFPIMKENRINELRLQSMKWRALYNPEDVYNMTHTPNGLPNKALSASLDAWLQSPQNASDIAYLLSLRNGALAGFAENHPTLWKLVNVLSDMGILDMVKTGAEIYGMTSLVP